VFLCAALPASTKLAPPLFDTDTVAVAVGALVAAWLRRSIIPSPVLCAAFTLAHLGPSEDDSSHLSSVGVTAAAVDALLSQPAASALVDDMCSHEPAMEGVFVCFSHRAGLDLTAGQRCTIWRAVRPHTGSLHWQRKRCGL
jgi:hypothetical protein